MSRRSALSLNHDRHNLLQVVYVRRALLSRHRKTQLPSKALFYFSEEGKTGIAPTRIIMEKDAVVVGATVTVNWQGEHVPAKVIALSSKYSCVIRK